MGTRALLFLSAVLCGVACARNQTGELKPNERFRRLIPYMTFYFAQQNYGSRPQFQQYHNSPAAVYPVSNNKLPQYPGNLVVPTTYLLRPTTQVKRPITYHKIPLTRPIPTQTFTLNDATNYNTLLNSDAYPDPLLHSYEVPQYKQYQNPPPVVSQPAYTAVKQPVLSSEERTNALIRILSILQEARRLPQAVTASNSVQTLTQILNILQQTSQLPIETQSSISKLLTQIPHYYKQPQAVSINTGEHLKTPVVTSNVGNPLLAIYTSKRPQHVTAAPVSEDVVNILQTYNTASPKPATSVSNPPIKTYTVTLAPISTTPTPIVENANDLQNYEPVNIPNVKVVPNGEDSNKPLTHTPTPAPTPSTADPVGDEADNLQPYGYAKKVPQDYKPPSYYGGSTYTQSFPDPNSEGSTPGQPGIDYPTYSSIPPTSFTCKTQRYKGFFGDPETSCQVWHYCDLNGGQASFLCPNGTIFSQVGLTCDWWFNVRCASTTQLYVLNERLYKYILPVMPSFPEDYSGPLVDEYLTLKFQELESKKKAKSQEKTTTTEAPPPSEDDQH